MTDKVKNVLLAAPGPRPNGLPPQRSDEELLTGSTARLGAV